MHRLPYKTKQFFFVLIKLSIVVGAFYFICQKLLNNENLKVSDFIDFLSKTDAFFLKNMTFLIFLSIFNWFFEILKWQNLISYVKKISFKNALEQSLGALTASLFTPNRIGEYGAKAIYFQSNLRKRVLLINLLSNILQMGATICFGIIGLWFFSLKYNPDINYFKFLRFFIISLSILVFIVFGISKSNFTIKGFSKEKIKTFIKKYPKNKLIYGFLLSVLRYIIFSFQFYFLLTLFSVEITYLSAMVFITSMYLLASIIPSIFIFDVVVKGSIAVYVFSFFGINELVVLSIVTTMWLLNFVLPSIFGSYYVLNFNLPKTDESL